MVVQLDKYQDPEQHEGVWKQYLLFAARVRRVVEGEPFNYFVLGVIVLAGFLVGVQTDPRMDPSVELVCEEHLVQCTTAEASGWCDPVEVQKYPECSNVTLSGGLGDQKHWSYFFYDEKESPVSPCVYRGPRPHPHFDVAPGLDVPMYYCRKENAS